MKAIIKFKNMILRIIAIITSIYTLLFILSLDSLTIDQLINGGILACICSLYLAILVYANLPDEE